ncbi:MULTISPECIES: DNA polymerase III subunit delta [Bacillaceae]|uniref:DNA polymerase III subunit delta n=1 Tax=Evansella alkalicola TaxID=745819 RepID=A0ABS6JVE0_9BACI|nr:MULTISPECIES: DNA polymerase III subunit delta [Bacillaceae]MBU9722524.1 DNA polymerase III subunit delta [Bacillus alkalicola]
MSYIDIVKQLKKGSVSPLYLLYGSEGYLIEDTLQRIIDTGLEEGEREFNLSKYDMKEYPIEVAIEEAYTFPFMGGRRIVILKDAFFFTAAKEKTSVEHDLNKLEGYLENPAPETIFIMVAPYEKLDERKKIVKLAKKNGAFMDGSPLEEKELHIWVHERAKEQGVEINVGAIDQLITLCGAQLMLMASELVKLAIHVGEGATIYRDHVDSLVARSLEQNIFALVDGVVKQNIDQSWSIYQDLLKQKEEPLKIISLMVRQFRILYQVKQLMQQGYSQKQIAGQLKLHPYVVKLAGGQARQFKDEELLNLLDQLADMDYKIKTGQLDKFLAVELFFSKRSRQKV